MGHDQELRAVGETGELGDEASHVGLVEGGVDLVEDAEGGGVHGKEGEEEGDGRERAFTAGEEAERAETLAGRLGLDLDAGIDDVVGIEELEASGAPAEEGGEVVAEGGIDLVEGGSEARANLAVELGDGALELRLRVGQVLDLLGEEGVPLLALAKVVGRLLVDGPELADGGPDLLDLALGGGEVGSVVGSGGGVEPAAGREALAGHLGPQGLEAFAGAVEVGFEVEVAAAGFEQGGLRFAVFGLHGALMGLEAEQLIAVGSAVVGRALLLDAKLLELPGLALDRFGEVARFELEVLGAEDALGYLGGEALDSALLLLAGEGVSPGLALGGGEPRARLRDLLDCLLDAGGGGFEVGTEGVELGAERLATVGEAGEQRPGLLGGPLIDEAAGEVAPPREDDGHLAADAVQAVALAFAGAQGLVEGGAALFVGAVALLDEAGEVVDGFAGAVDLLAVRPDDALELHDLAGKLVDLALAGEAEGALGVGHDTAGDDAGGVEEDAVERDDRAEAAADHPPGDPHVLDDDDAAEEGINEVAEAAVAADEAGSDADDAALLLQVERVDLAQAIEGQELGAAASPFPEELDGVEGLGLAFDDDGVEVVLEGGVDGGFEAGGDAQVAGEQADDAGDLGRFAEAARLHVLDEDLAHDEGVARAGGDAFALGLDALEDFEAALEVVEAAEGLLARLFEVAQLVADAGEPFAGAGGGLAGLAEARLGGGGERAQVGAAAAVGDVVREQHPPALADARRLGALGGGAGGTFRNGALLPDAFVEGGDLAAELLGAAVQGGVLALGEGERLAGAFERGAERFDLVGQLHGAASALEVGGGERRLLPFERLHLGANLAVAGRGHAVALAVEDEGVFEAADAALDVVAGAVAAGDGLTAPPDLLAEGLELLFEGGDAGLGVLVLGAALVELGLGAGHGGAGLAPAGGVEAAEEGGEAGGKVAVLAGAVGLAAEEPEAGLQLVDDDLDLRHVLARALEAVVGVGDLRTEGLDVGGLVDERAAVLGGEAEHLVDHALAHDGVAVLADVGLLEEVVEVAQPDAGAVQQVLGVAVAVGAASDLDLAVVEGEPAVAVIEGEGDLGHAEGGAVAAAGEDDVLLLAGAEEAQALLAEHPADGIGDVALAGAVGPDDGGDAGAELEGRLLGEALEALEGEALDVHGSGPHGDARSGID